MSNGWKRAVEAARYTRLKFDLAPVDAISLGLDDFFDLPEGEPVVLVDTRRVRLGLYRGVSRSGQIMVEVPGLKRRISTGFKTVLLPASSLHAWRFQ